MEIKILGTGCARCNSLEKAAKKAVDNLGISADLTKEEDILKIMEYGILRTPGLVIDGKVVSTGKVLSVNEIEELITKTR